MIYQAVFAIFADSSSYLATDGGISLFVLKAALAGRGIIHRFATQQLAIATGHNRVHQHVPPPVAMAIAHNIRSLMFHNDFYMFYIMVALFSESLQRFPFAFYFHFLFPISQVPFDYVSCFYFDLHSHKWFTPKVKRGRLPPPRPGPESCSSKPKNHRFLLVL